MKRMPIMLFFTLLVGIGFGSVANHLLTTQQTGIIRTMLLKTNLEGVEGREAILGTATLSPGLMAGKHSHHGDELGYVVEGTAVLKVEAQLSLTLKPGDTYHIAANRAHDARNIGPTPAKVLSIYVVEKGKPLAVSVP
jgi:quercetin dioxygenase-like cupin family protein